MSLIAFVIFLKGGLNPIRDFLFVKLPEDFKKNNNDNNNYLLRTETNNLLTISNPHKKLTKNLSEDNE